MILSPFLRVTMAFFQSEVTPACVDRNHFDFEQLLHGLADLALVRAAVRHHGVLIELFTLARALFRQPGCLNDFKRVHQSFKRSSSFSNAPRVKSSFRGRRTW